MFLSLAPRPLLSERTRRAQAPGTEAAIQHWPRYALSVFHSPWAVPVFLPGAPIPPGPRIGPCIRVTVPFQPYLGVPLVPIPVMILLWCVLYGCCSSVSSGVIWGLCPLQPCQSPSDLGVLVSVSYTPAGHQFVLLLFSVCRRMPEGETPCQGVQASHSVF